LANPRPGCTSAPPPTGSPGHTVCEVPSRPGVGVPPAASRRGCS
jgi:hypothetical protein